MSFFKISFKGFVTKKMETQTYKAPDMEDAKRQHERTNELMRHGSDPEYVAEIVTCHEVTSKSELKRLATQW